MANRKPIEFDEWYHCYNRGVDKRKVFMDERDCERLLMLMHLSRYPSAVQIFNIDKLSLAEVLRPSELAGQEIVDIGAYALMPNHFHFVLKETTEGGIARFMQKVFTGYTMYFNQKYERTGALFAGTYKSKHVEDDRYLKQVISYVHLNPADLFEPKWRESDRDIARITKGLGAYPYASLPDFQGRKRPHNTLIAKSIFKLFDRIPTTHQMIRDAKVYESLRF